MNDACAVNVIVYNDHVRSGDIHRGGNFVNSMSLSLKSASSAEFMGDKSRRRRRRELNDDQKQEIVEAFNLFDTDKDQAVDYHELKVHSTGSLSRAVQPM